MAGEGSWGSNGNTPRGDLLKIQGGAITLFHTTTHGTKSPQITNHSTYLLPDLTVAFLDVQ